jgi:hypothetical protein
VPHAYDTIFYNSTTSTVEEGQHGQTRRKISSTLYQLYQQIRALEMVVARDYNPKLQEEEAGRLQV